MKILVADKLAEEGLDVLKAAGVPFDIKIGLGEADLAAAVGEYDALIVRSGAKVTAKVLTNPGQLKAIARAGGLNDYKADPGGVFLLRFEPAPLVAQFVPGTALPPGGNLVPVIYRLNLRDAHSFFLARSFAMKDKDIIYIANSASDQIGKFLGLVGLVTSPVISGVATYGAVK